MSILPDPIDVLLKVAAIPSVSPMRPDLPDEIVGEARLSAFLKEILHQMGLEVFCQTVAPGRENIVAWLDGEVPPTQGGRVILFDAHQDTVPVDGMTIPAFQPQQCNGRIYGRGACDVKGGMAAMLSAIARLAHERPSGLPTIVVSCTVDEENGFRGVRRLTESWVAGGKSSPIPRPDAAIVMEPTGLDVVVAHKGVIRWKTCTHGRAAHSSSPQLGDNAVYHMARVLSAVEQYATMLANDANHPYCGAATVSVGAIHGGAGVNTVPDRCEIEIDQRPLPGEHLAAARQRLLDYVRHSADVELDSEQPYLEAPALSNHSNGKLAEQLAATVHGITGTCRLTSMPCCTNAPFYAAAGIPTVVFGPGSLEQAHTVDEWLSTEQLLRATTILDTFCRGSSGSESINTQRCE